MTFVVTCEVVRHPDCPLDIDQTASPDSVLLNVFVVLVLPLSLFVFACVGLN